MKNPGSGLVENDNRSAVRGLVLLVKRAQPFRVGVLFVFSSLLAFLLSPYITRPVAPYRLGEFTSSAIRAPFDFSVTDETATQRKREDAIRETTPVADLQLSLSAERVKRIQEIFAPVLRLCAEADNARQVPEEELAGLEPAKRGALIQERAEQADRTLSEGLKAELPLLEESLGVTLSSSRRKVLVKMPSFQALEDAVTGLVRDAYAQPVVSDFDHIRQVVIGDPAKEDGPGRLAVRDPVAGTETVVRDIGVLRVPDRLQGMLNERASVLFPELDAAQRSVAVEMALPQISPNLFFNEDETRKRRLEAGASVIPVSYTFKTNQLIIGEGQEITDQKLLVLRYLRDRGLPKEFFLHLVGSTLFLFMLIVAGYWMSDQYGYRFKLKDRDFLFLGVSLVSFTLLFRLWLLVVNELVARQPSLPHTALVLLFPVATVAMTTRLMLNFEVAILQAAIVAFLARMLTGMDLPFAAYTFIVGLVATHAVGGSAKRSDVLKAGLWVAAVSCACAASMLLLSDKEDTPTHLVTVLCALGGGLVTGFFVVAISPLAEWAFGYTTDVSLLEMANYDHPLLKKIMIEAPGTFQHSINISVLAEASANAVGANPLLARIGALYHDAGKSNNPTMFVENQAGENPHDLLPPEESARIIREHVQDGVRLVLDHGLGERVADFVREHHGTGVIKYFWTKAQDEGKPVEISAFSYPGPKPMSKETGILMLADQVEATSRTMESKREDELREMVRQAISRIHGEGQLDECPLTLRDLARIEDVFVKMLRGIHHNRVKYPGQKS